MDHEGSSNFLPSVRKISLNAIFRDEHPEFYKYSQDSKTKTKKKSERTWRQLFQANPGTQTKPRAKTKYREVTPVYFVLDQSEEPDKVELRYFQYSGHQKRFLPLEISERVLHNLPQEMQGLVRILTSLQGDESDFYDYGYRYDRAYGKAYTKEGHSISIDSLKPLALHLLSTKKVYSSVQLLQQSLLTPEDKPSCAIEKRT